jgi:uncharacterized glyoxalase superfamily protein PhnB
MEVSRLSATVPILRYRDAPAAIDWLCRMFGFEVFLQVPGEAGRIEHARLVLEGNMIMLASIGRQGRFEGLFRLPAAAGGVTQCVSLFVQDPDRIYRAARAEGAAIVDEIEDFRFGGRIFSCMDPESHLWVLGSHDPWKKLW